MTISEACKLFLETLEQQAREHHRKTYEGSQWADKHAENLAVEIDLEQLAQWIYKKFKEQI